MKFSVINSGKFKLDGGAMFGVVPKKIWNNLVPADSNNLCTWAMRCLLVETGNRLILVDAGMGNKQDAKFFGHYEPHESQPLEAAISKAGYAPSEVTDVFLTHLHFDHCGGAVVRRGDGKLVPQFTKATYWSNEKHWQWAVEPNAREKASFLKENILPLQESGQLQFVPESTAQAPVQFMSGVEVYTFNGHTEAQMVPVFEHRGRKLAFVCDLLPSPHHIPLPYVMGYDIRPLVTLNEKQWFLQKALEQDMLLFYEHDAHMECGLLTQTEKGIRSGETGALRDFWS